MHRSKSPGDMPFDLHPLPCKARANFFRDVIFADFSQSCFLSIPICPIMGRSRISQWGLGQGFDRSFGWSKEKGADHRSGLRL